MNLSPKNLPFDVVSLAQDLCAISSISGQEDGVVDFVEKLLSSRGLVVKRQKVSSDSSRDNLFICSPQNLCPKIVLSTHLDTVPPFFAPEIKDGWLVARGACDAKGIAASMICAAEKLYVVGEHSVGLLFLVGEESTSDGAKTVSTDFVPALDYIINGEPTDLKLVSAMKGVLAFRLVAHGRAGHSAYPESGYSAVHQLTHDLARLLNEKWPIDAILGETTLNIGTIEGGKAANVIADFAVATCIMRISTDLEHMEKRVRELLHPDTQIEIRSKSPPQILHTVPGLETCTVNFGSDVPFLKKLGKPLLIGPGSILDAHTNHDRVKVTDLHDAVGVYENLVKKLLS